MVFGILYIVMGLIVGLAVAIYMTVNDSYGPDASDYVLYSVAGLFAGGIWPVSLVVLLFALLLKGVEKYKDSLEEKKREEKKKAEELALQTKRDDFYSQYQTKINLILFDRRTYEVEGWTRENYSKLCASVESLVSEMVLDSPYELRLYRNDIRRHLEFIKPVISLEK